MRGGLKAGFVALLVPVLLLTVSCASSEDDKAPNRYPSPKAVFDAFREARTKEQMGKIFFLVTPEVQDGMVFESFFECAALHSEEASAVAAKYVDLATLDQDHAKQYKTKHGIDPDKATASQKDDPASAPPDDDQLWQDVVVEHVKDKVGFVVAVSKLSKDPIEPLGDLESLAIDGDTATGTAKQTFVPGPGESPPAVDKIDKEFRFRKINGGWLLDSL